MKVKVKKSFVSGFYAGDPGDDVDIPDRLAAKLIKLDVVKPAARGEPQEAPADTHSGSGSPVKSKAGEQPAPARKKAKTGKSAAKAAE